MTVGVVRERPEIHERALEHARRLAPGMFDDHYVLFKARSDGELHGVSTCATGPVDPVRLTVDEIVSLPLSSDVCECGGWRSTSFFPALLIAHRSLELHRIVEDGGIDDCAEAIEQIERMQPWWRPDLENVGHGLAVAARLAAANSEMELDILDGFARRLDPAPLVTHVAAHGMRMSTDVVEAREFLAWVESLDPRYVDPRRKDTPLSVGRSRRELLRSRFDLELDALTGGPRRVVLIERRLGTPEDVGTWRIPSEVLLLSLTGGNSARSSFAWLLLPDAAVAGLRALLAQVPGATRLGVVDRDVLPPAEVRAIAESLWQENDGTWHDLDGILAAAEGLDDVG